MGEASGVGDVVGLPEAMLAAGVALLLGGFAFAAVSDLRTREVSDTLWQVLGIAGFVLGLVAVGPGGPWAVALWCVVAGLTLEHMFAWDERLGGRWRDYADLLELTAYIAVVVLIGLALARIGLGPTGVPVPVLAVLVSVLFARGLFEAGVLYGGADAKALMIAGLLVPMFPDPWVGFVTGARLTVTGILPFSVDLLMNAALLSIVVPLALAARNVSRGEFSFARGFTGFSLPVRDLPKRFVWVRDPRLPSAREREEEIETSEEDRKFRVEVAQDLSRKGVDRVWVTPQLPFLVLMGLGAVAALIAGNLVIDILLSL